MTKELLRMIPGVAQAEGAARLAFSKPGLVALGAAALAVNGVLHPFGIENNLNVEAGEGQLEEVYTLPFPEECNTAFVSEVTGATAEYSKTITIEAFGLKAGIPTGYSDKEGFDGEITSDVCRDATKATVWTDSKERPCPEKVCVSIPGDAYHARVYMTDPTAGPMHTIHNGITNAIIKNFETDLHILPKVEYKGMTDSLSSRLRGYALIAAEFTAAQGCGEVAWKYLRPMEELAIQKSITAYGAALNPDLQLSMDGSDVNVQLPAVKDVKFDTQYGKSLDEIKEKGGEHLTVSVGDVGPCEESPDLAKYLANHPVGTQEAAALQGNS